MRIVYCFIRHYSHSTFPIKINIGGLQDIGLLIALEKIFAALDYKAAFISMFLLYCAVGNVIPPTQNIHNNINISQYREEGRNQTENTKNRKIPYNIQINHQYFIVNSLEMTFVNNDIQSRQQNWVQYLVMMNHFKN